MSATRPDYAELEHIGDDELDALVYGTAVEPEPDEDEPDDDDDDEGDDEPA